MIGRQRKVTKATHESVARFSRGYVVGSRTRWVLVLKCGHTVTRYGQSPTKLPPTKALCKECLDP